MLNNSTLLENWDVSSDHATEYIVYVIMCIIHVS